MPTPPLEPAVQVDDPALDGSDWTFQRDGQVYGPVEGRRLAQLLYTGEVSASTLVSDGDGTWQPIGQVARFFLHVKKAEVALRVEQEVTGARALRARKARFRTATLVLAGLGLVAGAGGVAVWQARSGVDHSALLEDFGAGITVAVAARVGVARPAGGADEIEVPVAEDPAAPRAAGTATGRAGSPGTAGGSATGGDELVATHFDPNRIQDVVNRQQRTLAPCLRAEAVRVPDFAGEVPLEFTIGNEGKVVRVVITDPRLRQGPLRDCFEQVLSAWNFEKFPGQRPSVSLVFRVGQ
jgi:hypothetical protein